MLNTDKDLYNNEIRQDKTNFQVSKVYIPIKLDFKKNYKSFSKIVNDSLMKKTCENLIDFEWTNEMYRESFLKSFSECYDYYVLDHNLNDEFDFEIQIGEDVEILDKSILQVGYYDLKRCPKDNYFIGVLKVEVLIYYKSENYVDINLFDYSYTKYNENKNNKSKNKVVDFSLKKYDISLFNCSKGELKTSISNLLIKSKYKVNVELLNERKTYVTQLIVDNKAYNLKPIGYESMHGHHIVFETYKTIYVRKHKGEIIFPSLTTYEVIVLNKIFMKIINDVLIIKLNNFKYPSLFETLKFNSKLYEYLRTIEKYKHYDLSLEDSIINLNKRISNINDSYESLYEVVCLKINNQNIKYTYGVNFLAIAIAFLSLILSLCVK